MNNEKNNETETEVVVEYVTEYVDGSSNLSIKFWIVVILVCAFLALCLINAKQRYSSNNNLTPKEELGANVTINYDQNTNKFSITDYTHTKDYLGKSSQIDKCFDFTVDVHLKQAKIVIYELSLKKDSTSNINDNEVHIYLEKKNPLSGVYEPVFEPTSFKLNQEETSTGTPKGYMILNNTNVTETGKDYYRLRMWLTESSTTNFGNYTVEVQMNAKAE